MSFPRCAKRAGTTLAEVIICTTLVGGLVVASMQTVTATRLTQRLMAGHATGPGLAQELLSEVLAQAYADPLTPDAPIGADAAEPTRRFYDDVDDYDNYSEMVQTRRGASYPGYSGWRYAVEVAFVNRDLIRIDSDQGLKLVTVTATSPDEEETRLSGLRSRDGMLEQAPPVDTEAVVWLGLTLRTSDSPVAARTGVHLPNLVADPIPPQ